MLHTLLSSQCVLTGIVIASPQRAWGLHFVVKDLQHGFLILFAIP